MTDRRLPRRTVLAMATGAAAVLANARGGHVIATMPGGSQPKGGAAANRQEDPAVSVQTNKELWGPWLALWNGDLSVADELIAPEFVAHFAPVGASPAEVRGPDGLKEWIGGVLAAFTDHRFATTVGPLADGDLLAGRWLFRATYQGGIPGAAPDATGTQVEYAGIDILRVETGRIAEYWLSADILVMLQQVGVIPS